MNIMGSYSDFYKKKMDSVFNKAEIEKQGTVKKYHLSEFAKKDQIPAIPRESPVIQRKINDFSPKFNARPVIPRNLWLVFFCLVAALVVLFFVKKTSAVYFIIAIALVCLFFVLFFLHKHYEKAIHKSNPFAVLFIMYLVLAIDIILSIKGVYSVEWAFLGFLAAAVVFYDSRIDSRFLIFPALLLLGYIPFLLIGKQNLVAETAAVYVYYFLVAGVGLQVAQFIQKNENSADFAESFMIFIKKINWIYVLVVAGILNLAIIVLNRFYELEIYKWTLVFVFAVCFVFYIISSASEKKY